VTILIALLIALLAVAVGYVIYCVSTIVVAIVKDHIASRKPRRKFQHPEFGVLTLDGELWNGKAGRNANEIPFLVAGSDSAPDSGLMQRLSWFLDNFTELERIALNFIRKQEPEVRHGKFTFTSVSFLWEERPKQFAMEFDLAGDDDGIWRVEFDDNQPQFLGRDD